MGDLLQEMMIMQQVGPHPNVVTLLGVCVEQGAEIKTWIELQHLHVVLIM